MLESDETDPRAELLRQAEELAALHETTLDLIERLDLSSVLESIVTRAGALVGAPDGWIYLREPGEDELSVRHGTGVFVDRIGYRIRPGEGVAGRVWSSGEPFAVNDYLRWPGRRRDADHLALSAVAGVPLRAGDEIIGVLGLAYLDGTRRFAEKEIALLSRFGQLASVAVENARLYTAAQRELAERRRTEDELLDAVSRLQSSEHELQNTREEIARRLSYAADLRDAETGRHVERMGRFCALLARRLGLEEERCELVRIASPLHDVGKIALSDTLLKKQGQLAASERREMERHTEVGRRILSGSGSELLELAAMIAWTHHERFDGRGYPRGLRGEAIPLEGRIAAVADVFDALTSDRPYRPAFPVEEALRMMREGRGTQFDPLVLDLFLDSIGELLASKESDQAEAPPDVGTGRPPARQRPPSRLRRIGGRRALARDRLSLEALETATEEAERLLLAGGDDRQAIDAALARLHDIAGPELLASVYVREHDRLWCLAQCGYVEVRDGFSLDQGVMGRAVRTGEVQFVADSSSDPDFVAAEQGLHSEITVPFGDGVGALNIESRRVELPEASIPAMERLAEALATRVVSMRTELRFDLAALARLFVYASSLRGVDAIAEFAARTLGRLLDVESAQLSLGRSDTGYKLASFWRRTDSELVPLAPSDLEKVAGLVQQASGAFNILDLRSAPVSPSCDQSRPWLAWLPLEVAGNQIGVLVGRTAEAPSFDHEVIESATLFAPHAAALIDVAQALRREQRAAVTDELTGLLNRRGFEQRFREELERAERAERALAVVTIDCDGLKEINDRGGHQLGDQVLLIVARCLKAGKRAGDVAARLGGDEFALLLPETSADAALDAAERLRGSLVEQVLEDRLLVSATFGVATFPADGATSSDLLRAADDALYAAKEGGRNRTVVFGRRTAAPETSVRFAGAARADSHDGGREPPVPRVA